MHLSQTAPRPPKIDIKRQVAGQENGGDFSNYCHAQKQLLYKLSQILYNTKEEEEEEE